MRKDSRLQPAGSRQDRFHGMISSESAECDRFRRVGTRFTLRKRWEEKGMLLNRYGFVTMQLSENENPAVRRVALALRSDLKKVLNQEEY